MTDMLTASQVYGLMSDAIAKAGSQAAYARKLKISATFLHDALHARKDIPAAVLADLGLIKVTRFARKKEASPNGE